MRCPPDPKRRPPIHPHKMGGNSGDCSQSPSGFKVSTYAEKDRSTSPPYIGSNDDDDNDSGKGDDPITEKVEGTERLTNKPEHTKENTASPYKQPWKYYLILLGLCIAVCIAVYIAVIDIIPQDGQDKPKLNKFSVRKAIEPIREEFPSQLERIWGEFSAGINETVEGTPTKPSVFMLLYETEEGTAICLAQKLGNISTRLLHGEKSYPLLIIDGEDLEHDETLAEDYGKLLEEYRPKVEEQGAMVINNLHKIPGTVAQTFHSFCDTVTPAVEKAVYLFTMKASRVISNSHNPTEVAEEELRRLWSDELDEDKLNPLITRITDMTMMIRPEKNLASCGR